LIGVGGPNAGDAGDDRATVGSTESGGAAKAKKEGAVLNWRQKAAIRERQKKSESQTINLSSNPRSQIEVQTYFRGRNCKAITDSIASRELEERAVRKAIQDVVLRHARGGPAVLICRLCYVGQSALKQVPLGNLLISWHEFSRQHRKEIDGAALFGYVALTKLHEKAGQREEHRMASLAGILAAYCQDVSSVKRAAFYESCKARLNEDGHGPGSCARTILTAFFEPDKAHLDYIPQQVMQRLIDMPNYLNRDLAQQWTTALAAKQVTLDQSARDKLTAALTS